MKRYKWTVEFTVDATWVADGFDLTDERAMAMLQNDLGYARQDELGAKVIKAPDPQSDQEGARICNSLTRLPKPSLKRSSA